MPSPEGACRGIGAQASRRSNQSAGGMPTLQPRRGAPMLAPHPDEGLGSGMLSALANPARFMAFSRWAAPGLGGLSFAFLGGTGAALALASRRGGLLIAVVVLPLLTPPVIFGGAAIANFDAGLPWQAALSLLAAYTLGCIALTPFAMAGACRNAQS